MGAAESRVEEEGAVVSDTKVHDIHVIVDVGHLHPIQLAQATRLLGCLPAGSLRAFGTGDGAGTWPLFADGMPFSDGNSIATRVVELAPHFDTAPTRCGVQQVDVGGTPPGSVVLVLTGDPTTADSPVGQKTSLQLAKYLYAQRHHRRRVIFLPLDGCGGVPQAIVQNVDLLRAAAPVDEAGPDAWVACIDKPSSTHLMQQLKGLALDEE